MCDVPNVLVENAETTPFGELSVYYDTVLNTDKSTYHTKNDEPTPIGCVVDMVSQIPSAFWDLTNLTILDPCCGNGNFHVVILHELLKHRHTYTHIIEHVLEFADINESRLENVRRIFRGAHAYNRDFLTHTSTKKYDLIVANPPYACILASGKRAAKNHNMIKMFIQTALVQLKPGGYLLFITPDNWMSCADRNTLISELTALQILRLDIHSAKRHFKKMGRVLHGISLKTDQHTNQCVYLVYGMVTRMCAMLYLVFDNTYR